MSKRKPSRSSRAGAAAQAGALLQQGHPVSGLGQQPGRRQPGDAAADHDHGLFGGAAGRRGRPPSSRRRVGPPVLERVRLIRQRSVHAAAAGPQPATRSPPSAGCPPGRGRSAARPRGCCSIRFTSAENRAWASSTALRAPGGSRAIPCRAAARSLADLGHQPQLRASSKPPAPARGNSCGPAPRCPRPGRAGSSPSGRPPPACGRRGELGVAAREPRRASTGKRAGTSAPPPRRNRRCIPPAHRRMLGHREVGAHRGEERSTQVGADAAAAGGFRRTRGPPCWCCSRRAARVRLPLQPVQLLPHGRGVQAGRRRGPVHRLVGHPDQGVDVRDIPPPLRAQQPAGKPEGGGVGGKHHAGAAGRHRRIAE